MVTDNRTFWKTVKPYLSNKVLKTEKLTLIENEKLVDSDETTAEIFNHFFTNAISNLNIEKFSKCDPLAENVTDKVLKAIVRYRNHPSVICIREKLKGDPFSFNMIGKNEIVREIRSLSISKGVHNSDLPTKIVKENLDIFAEFIR